MFTCLSVYHSHSFNPYNHSDTAGNETVTPKQMLQYLSLHGYDLFTDIWAENFLYFGNKGNEIIDTDRMFGSKKFKLMTDKDVLDKSARGMLMASIDADTFDRDAFLKKATDIIAIERKLADQMKIRWSVPRV